MLEFFLDLKVILPSLLLLNLLFIFLFKNEYRFVKGQIILFTILLLVSLIYRLFIYPAVNQNIQDEKNEEIKKHGWNYLNMPEIDSSLLKKEIENIKVNIALFKITGFQAVFSFIIACIGIFISSEKKIYAGYALGFFVIAYLLLI